MGPSGQQNQILMNIAWIHHCWFMPARGARGRRFFHDLAEIRATRLLCLPVAFNLLLRTTVLRMQRCCRSSTLDESCSLKALRSVGSPE